MADEQLDPETYLQLRDSNTITPRMRPLERKGLIARTDRRGPGRSGLRSQIVWRVT